MRISKRHLAKSFTWRFIGSLDTFIFTWLYTGDYNVGLNLAAITTITKLIWYYIHEQIWFKSDLSDTSKRHLMKTFTWRIIGTVDTVIFGWLITGNPLTSLKIGGIETLSKMLLYFGHEKLWYKINFGLDMRIKEKRLKKLREKRNLQNR
ncbi:MAG: putative membrane protein [Psychroserpens sp.]|jgi:uncharacterized membrane protein